MIPDLSWSGFESYVDTLDTKGGTEILINLLASCANSSMDVFLQE